MQLAATQPDGSSLRDHLQAAANAGARPDPRLSSRPPAVVATLWDAFVALNGARIPGVSGSGPILPSEVVAWQQLHRVRLTPWEAETLLAMGRATANTTTKGH